MLLARLRCELLLSRSQRLAAQRRYGEALSALRRAHAARGLPLPSAHAPPAAIVMAAVVARGLNDLSLAEKVLQTLTGVELQPWSPEAPPVRMFLDYFAILLASHIELARGAPTVEGPEIAEVASMIDLRRIGRSTAKSFGLWQRFAPL